ncbi:hypothetical protein BKA70DRAFT_1448392 [Coprinopsis sp. MPI-PUGE-AT-0042]|nr:hypothetical protein BKA70DRAFT_1448392 [Coprinopsis sp. MPI-PUGE-AT-0042]
MFLPGVSQSTSIHLTTSVRGGNAPLLLEIHYPTTEDGKKIHPSLLEAHSVNSAFRIPSCFCGEDVEVCDTTIDGQEKEVMICADRFCPFRIDLTVVYTNPSALSKCYKNIEEECDECHWQSYQLLDDQDCVPDSDSDSSIECDGDYPEDDDEDGYISSTDSIHDFVVPDNFIEWASDSESDYEDAFFTVPQESKQKKRYRSPDDGHAESAAHSASTRPEKRLRIVDAK